MAVHKLFTGIIKHFGAYKSVDCLFMRLVVANSTPLTGIIKLLAPNINVVSLFLN